MEDVVSWLLPSECIGWYQPKGGSWFCLQEAGSSSIGFWLISYRKLVVHGFAVDEEGHKMAKSIGNVVDPAQIINGFSVRNSNIHKICK